MVIIMRLLIEEDELDLAEALTVFFEKNQFSVDAVNDGFSAYEYGSSGEYDAIILDVMMPKLSGFEVCEKLKKEPETSSVMILMVTALSDLGDVERAVAVGCDDFLSKPINQIELLIRVENLLKLRSVTSELERLRQYVDSMEDAFAPKKKA